LGQDETKGRRAAKKTSAKRAPSKSATRARKAAAKPRKAARAKKQGR
jgi:hypothetical protein